LRTETEQRETRQPKRGRQAEDNGRHTKYRHSTEHPAPGMPRDRSTGEPDRRQCRTDTRCGTQ